MTHSEYEAAAQTETKTRPIGDCVQSLFTHTARTVSRNYSRSALASTKHHAVGIARSDPT